MSSRINPFAVVLVLITALAQAPVHAGDDLEPARGTALRADMLDAVRPLAEWQLSAPVVFQVLTLRSSGDAGFASLQPQRPDGSPVPLDGTLALMLAGGQAEDFDGTRIDALMLRSGRMWVVVEYSIGSTDAWWASPVFCDRFGAVLVEICG